MEQAEVGAHQKAAPRLLPHGQFPLCYPEAKCHQLVPLVLDQGYFIGSQSHDVCQLDRAGPVCFDVNTLDPQAARGHYAVTIWSWS